jgi:inositol-phosphate transport system permease protein
MTAVARPMPARPVPRVIRPSALVPYVVLLLWTLPILILYVWLFYSSFFPRIEGFRPIGDFTLDNWRFLWDPQSVPQMRNRPAVVPLTINTFIFAAMTSAVGLLVSSMAGYAFSRLRFKGRRVFLGGVLLLHSFPSVTLLIALFVVLRALGLYDKLVGVILVQTAFALPFGIWIMKGFFDNVPWDLEMSALVDGAGRFRTWWRIMLPLVKPGLLALAVLLFVEGWNQFLLPFVFMPSGSQQTLSTLVRGVLGEGRFVDYGLLTAVGLYYIAPVLVLFVLAQDQLMRIYAGGVKG